jgi:ribosomal protein S18 acetylase RimI-like enzyme
MQRKIVKGLLAFLVVMGSCGYVSSFLTHHASSSFISPAPKNRCVYRAQPHLVMKSSMISCEAVTVPYRDFEMQKSKGPLDVDGRVEFKIRHAAAEELSDIGRLIAEAFIPEGVGILSTPLRRWTWLQVYVGMLERIFASSFAHGQHLAALEREADAAVVAMRRADTPPPHAVLVAIDPADGGSVGAAELYLRPCPVPAGRVMAPAPFLCNLAVRPERRGSGAARALLLACEAEASAWGYEEIFLETDCSNVAALR